MSSKINMDKYYTPESLVLECINNVKHIIGEENITRYIEPSAGEGAFSLHLKDCLAFDIEPEHPSIAKQDYLKLDIPYEKGFCVIGNPPFGNKLGLAKKFFKKSILIADYIGFILPIGQLNNVNSFYEFDLIFSKDLGKQTYSDREIHCCFNIYKRPVAGLNKRKISKFEGVTIVRQDSKKFQDFDSDIRMCYWGDGSAGKILESGDNYSAEYKIKVDHPKKQEIIKLLKNTNWREELNCVAMLKIQQFHIHNLLLKNFK